MLLQLRELALRVSSGRTGRSIIMLALASSIALFGVAIVSFVLWPRWPGQATAANAPALPITVGGVNFNVPPDAIRISIQRRPGAQSRLDLAFPWPHFTVRTPAQKAVDLGSMKAPDQVFVTIVEAANKMPLTERLKTVYSRYVAAEAARGPDGLLKVTFREQTPYQGEDLFFQESQPEAFIARCTRNAGAAQGTCLIEQRIGGSDVTIRFPRDWLNDWEQHNQGFEQLLASLIPGRS
jgi:hypothetical protein